MTNESGAALKGGKRLGLLALLALLLFLLIYYFCCGDKGGSRIVIKEPIKAPHGIAFIDVNGAYNNVQKVKVTLIDPEKMVVSSNGVSFGSVDVTGGVMSIGLSSKASFSVEKPYRFFIRAEAEGYMTNIRTVMITEDAPNFIPVFMTKLDDLPPSGLAASVGSIANVVDGILQQPDTLRAIPRGDPGSMMTIAMPKGVQFLCGGKPVEAKGPLSFRLLQGMPRDSNANRVFPGGFTVSDAFDENGGALADPSSPGFFTTAGWFTMEMNIGNSGVDGFSEPLVAEMPIDKNMINPETNALVKPGDKLPLWSMDDRTGIWKREETLSVEETTGGGLKIRFPVRHLSTFNADWMGPLCSTGTARIDVNYTYDAANAAGFGGNRYARLLSRADGSEIMAKTINFDNTGTLQIIRVPDGISTQLLVHRGSTFIEPLQGSTGPMSCPSSGNALALIGGAPAGCTLLEFVTGATADPVVNQCNNSVWTKNNCADGSPFLFEGIINADGNVTTVSYPANKCVRLWFLNNSAAADEIFLQFTINYGIPVLGPGDTPPTGTITTNAAGGPYSFDYWKENMPPGSTCSTRIRVRIPAALVSGNGCM